MLPILSPLKRHYLCFEVIEYLISTLIRNKVLDTRRRKTLSDLFVQDTLEGLHNFRHPSLPIFRETVIIEEILNP